MSGPSKPVLTDKSAPCPVCGKPQSLKFAPFCTQRCADLDLGRWLKGSYVIPAAPDEAEAVKDAEPDED